MVEIAKKTIVICSIVRDAEKGLRANIPVVKEFVRLWGDYTVIIYENDSKDATKDLLKKWVDEDKKHIYIFMDNRALQRPTPKQSDVKCNPFFSRKRICKMVSLRNQYMEALDTMDISADYIMVVDLDVAQLNLSAILDTFNSEQEWDAVSANGYSIGPNLRRRYHDTYALTEYGDENNPQTEEKIKLLAEKYGRLKNGDNWIRVFSAFGGLTIYRYNAIKGLRYQLLPNNDSRVEVRCEHYSLYKQMAERGYNRIFINPSMMLKYQNLSFGIVWSSLIRKYKSVLYANLHK